ncbi:hypothetical protein H1R20_g10713, partial [Candolleomyces eurysporus]
MDPHTLSACVKRAVEHQGRSDHIPLSATIPLRHAVPKVKGRTLEPFSDEEKEFVADIVLDIGDLSGYHPTTAEEVERMTSAIANAFSTAWKKPSTEYIVGPNSREYWSDKCTRALEEYRREMSTENHKAFRSAVKAAKREFFDKWIEEVATANKHPWDLMEWVKERKNPPCEAIQFEGRPCHNLGDLWNALHSTYNAASDRPVDVSILEELPDELERPWPSTDSMSSARRLVEPSVHSGQAHSLAVCKALDQWPSEGEDRYIKFIGTPSKLEWGTQHQAHRAARSLPPIPVGRRPATTLDGVHKGITQSALNSWATMFRDERYQGSQFLVMRELKGTDIAPTYANGGSWLKSVGEDTLLCTRMCRAILNHAPIGKYYCQFNIQEDHVFQYSDLRTPVITFNTECGEIIIALANGCIESGHWPRHFKELTSVIIPKPNKPSYSTPKTFRPIVLLNTLGKLIEKMISNRFQHDMIKCDLVDPNQMGGVRQHSTEDAGLFLTHLVHSGWAQKLQTSVVAFDITQFFPSINHQFLLAVLEKLGFNRRVVTFFALYLVDRFTTYAWNRDMSDPRRADVGVGQGSALSPVLSVLVIAPVMKLFRKRSVGLGCTLISYVDDGDIIVQSSEIDMNCVMLQHAYSIVFELFTKLGLALEHDKTELFHFTRARTGFDRSLDLGYAPYTGDNPLKPKTYWRYLGFYFDRKLTFQEHVRYYTTKALTTVMAMRMLSNSTRGLSPRNKRILYRACMVPIATYGHRLWYFEGAKNKESSVSYSDPVRLPSAQSLMRGEHAKMAIPALGASCWMSIDRQKVVRDAITETSSKIHTLTEVFSPTAEENAPGERLLDRHQGRVLFDEFDPKGEDVLPKQRSFLDTLQRQAAQQRGTACCGTDCSVPKRTMHQATALFVIEWAGHNPATSTWAAGKTTSACAELFAIRAAVVRATILNGCDHIIVFTNSMSSARRSVDPSVHSGQAHSLAVCKALNQWLSEGEDRYIEFIGTLSKLEWGVQHKAHRAARSLPPIPVGQRPATTLDSVHKGITQSALNSRATMFQDERH